MALLAGVLIISLLLPTAVSLLARDTLPGITEQTDEIASSDDPNFRILEIVPDRSLARVGYYFGGQEPLLIKDDSGTVLLDTWDSVNQVWKPWQSVLELYGNQADREYYVNHLMEQTVKDGEMKDLVTVSGNIVVTFSNSLTVSGNQVGESGTRIVSKVDATENSGSALPLSAALSEASKTESTIGTAAVPGPSGESTFAGTGDETGIPSDGADTPGNGLSSALTVPGGDLSGGATATGNGLSDASTVPGEGLSGDATASDDGLSDAPLMLSTYKEVTKEQYDASPGEYNVYEIEARERKGYYKKIDSENYSGTRYNGTFAWHGELQAGDSGSFYQVAEALKITDPSDSSWAGLLGEDAYVKTGDRYEYWGQVGNVPTTVSEDEADAENSGMGMPGENGSGGAEVPGAGTGTGDTTGNGTGHGTGDTTGNGTGHGTGDTTGSGTGSGSGDTTGNGTGSGSGDTTGNGTGSGTGDTTGSGTGSGSGDTTGNNTGNGTGSGSGDTTGNGTGSGTGDTTGNGTGSGTGDTTGNGTGSRTGDTTGSGTGTGSSARTAMEGKSGAGNLTVSTTETASADGTGPVGPVPGEGEWQLFSAPSTPVEYYYLRMERASSPALGDGVQYYKADGFAPAEDGKWGIEYAADDDSFADPVSAPAMTVYYEGGIRNLEWFKRYSFDMEEEAFASFGVQVTTLTVSELNNRMVTDGFSLDQFDFISIRDGVYKEADGTGRKGFLDGNDMDLTTAQRLFETIMLSQIPTALDSSIAFAAPGTVSGTGTFAGDGTGAEAGGAQTGGTGMAVAAEAVKSFHTEMKNAKPNLWRLAVLLCQQSPERFLPEKDTAGNRPDFAFAGMDPGEWTDIEKGMGFPTDQDNNYVNQNIYCLYQQSFVNADYEKKVINDSTLDPTLIDANMEGFEDVLLEIESENMYREADAGFAGELLSTDIKESTVIRYILNYANQRATYLKTKIRILDIEPTVPDEKSFPLTKKDVMKWLAADSPITEDDITIDTMAVSEYIGRNDDINEKYDLVYIGTDADRLNLEKDDTTGIERTVFNDTSMNGMVYFHTGDYRYASALLGGQLDTEYGQEKNWRGEPVSGPRLYEYAKVRYSGLDLTKSKLEELTSYADASYPIVLSEDFYGKDTTGAAVINESYIDNSSYMYEFASTMLKENRKNVFSRKMLGGGEGGGKANVRLFSFYLNRPKLELTHTRVESASMGENGVYNIADRDGGYTLEYQFTISNVGAVSSDTRYRCDLYVDVNADGKFSPLERMEDIVLSGAEDAAADNLRAGVSYTLRRAVPEGYRGVLAWKIKVSQVNNGNIRSNFTGYSKMEGMEPETIHVLQICRDIMYWDGSTPWLRQGGWFENGYENNRRLNLESEFSNPNSNYYKLLYGGTINGVKYPGVERDFNIDVTCYTISEFEKLYEQAVEKEAVLRDYNMLILGFSDCYGNLEESTINGPGGITEFIDSGKSVLFAHDTTSYTNFDYGNYGYPDNNFDKSQYGVVNRDERRIETNSYGRYGNSLPTSYGLNRFVRPLVGMDRYGVNELHISRDADGGVTSVDFTGRSKMLKKGEALTENGDAWGLLNSTAHDIAWKPGSGRTETVPEVHGYTYTIIGLKDNNKSAVLDWPDVPVSGTKNTLLNYDFAGYTGQKELTDGAGDSVMNATKVNDGQITTYPFRLADEFMVSNTHGQYYQLDMNADDDHDGESDLVVWYCLGENAKESGSDRHNMYSISPNDVVNNYYIYNKGNITYTGMGHDGRNSAKPEYVEEAKLFINTIIAAYTASIKPSEVEIVDEKTEEKINDLYNYYDIGNDTHLDSQTAEYQKVYFTVQDTNFVKGTRNLSAAFYLESGEGSLTITHHGENYKVNRLEGLTVYEKDRNKDDTDDNNDRIVNASELSSGGVYYVRVPRVWFEDGNTRQTLFVESTSRINRYNEEIVTPPVRDKVDLVKLQLFELD